MTSGPNTTSQPREPLQHFHPKGNKGDRNNIFESMSIRGKQRGKCERGKVIRSQNDQTPSSSSTSELSHESSFPRASSPKRVLLRERCKLHTLLTEKIRQV